MRSASLTLDALALLCALAVVAGRLIRFQRLRVDHVVLFCLGHAYYFSVASLMRQTNALEGTYWFVYRYFAEVTEQRQFWTSVWSLALLTSFLGGSFIAERRRPVASPGARRRSRMNPELLFGPSMLLTLGALGVFVLIAVQYRVVILQGYRSLDPQGIQGEVGRGILSAVATATILSALFGIHVARQCADRRRQRLAIGVGALALAIPSALLLLAGGRLYVATAIIAILVWFTHVGRPIRRSIVIGAGVVGFVGLTAMGSIRTGELPDRETVGFYATSESVLTSISQGTFLASNREVFLPLRVPRYLASDLSNVLPRAIVPAKDSLRLDPEDDGFRVTSALGATQLQVSSLINFGYVGSLVVIGALGYGLSRLKVFVLGNRTSILTISYATCSAALTFTFFRDQFSISVVRWFVLNGFLLPLVYLSAVAVVRRDDLADRRQHDLTATKTRV